MVGSSKKMAFGTSMVLAVALVAFCSVQSRRWSQKATAESYLCQGKMTYALSVILEFAKANGSYPEATGLYEGGDHSWRVIALGVSDGPDSIAGYDTGQAWGARRNVDAAKNVTRAFSCVECGSGSCVANILAVDGSRTVMRSYHNGGSRKFNSSHLEKIILVAVEGRQPWYAPGDLDLDSCDESRYREIVERGVGVRVPARYVTLAGKHGLLEDLEYEDFVRMCVLPE